MGTRFDSDIPPTTVGTDPGTGPGTDGGSGTGTGTGPGTDGGTDTGVSYDVTIGGTRERWKFNTSPTGIRILEAETGEHGTKAQSGRDDQQVPTVPVWLSSQPPPPTSALKLHAASNFIFHALHVETVVIAVFFCSKHC